MDTLILVRPSTSDICDEDMARRHGQCFKSQCNGNSHLTCERDRPTWQIRRKASIRYGQCFFVRGLQRSSFRRGSSRSLKAPNCLHNPQSALIFTRVRTCGLTSLTFPLCRSLRPLRPALHEISTAVLHFWCQTVRVRVALNGTAVNEGHSYCKHSGT